jgi:hypothetical protein
MFLKELKIFKLILIILILMGEKIPEEIIRYILQFNTD